MKSKEDSTIAIVGIDCRYPGAHSLSQYWENILALRQQFRRLPDKRLNLDYYYSEDRNDKDSIYLQKAAVLANYHFDRIGYRVSKSTFEQTDMAHWLALDVAAGALKDAGFENGEGLDKKKVGCILGNSLNGEFTRANTMRLRWPYVFKVLESTLKGMNYSNEDIVKIITNTEKVYKAPFPEPDADTLAGGLSNTIAGRICNYFDFNGGGFTVDGACSSSLLSVAIGCNALRNEELSVVLVGGVDLSVDPFEVVGFSRNGALATDEMEVYNAKAQGFWPGEGCGVIVMMKETEAIERGLNIYGVIKGWGISSDGKGGITRPKPQTQQAAIEMAYKHAGYGMETVAMFEGHGTGTPVGDKVELTALLNSLKNTNKEKEIPAILGSVKHLIGHTKAAAGVAGLIKACLALKNNVIPPTRSTKTPHPLLEENESILQLASKPILWREKIPMRASVSSMGFGGINVHITIEEKENKKRQRKLSAKVLQLAKSNRDAEVFPISASSKELLLKQIQRLQSIARDISRSEFIDLSTTICASFNAVGSWKASFVASTPDQLLVSLHELEEQIANDTATFIDAEKGIFFCSTGINGKIGFLFPGQGAPIYKDMGGFDTFKSHFTSHNGFNVIGTEKVADTSIAQPSIIRDTLQSIELLENFGLFASCGIGNSLGEIASLSWAGAIDTEEAIQLAKIRGKAMSEYGEKGGAMLAVKCDESTIKRLMADKEVVITGFNGENNYVLGGSLQAINEVKELAFEADVQHAQLKVSHAFHTPMMKSAAKEFKNAIKEKTFEEIDRKVISTVTGEELTNEIDLYEHLFQQIEQPVLFTQAIAAAKSEIDLFIEVGPGNALTRSLSNYEDINVLALDFGSNSIKGFLNILSAAYVFGESIRFEELSFNRHYHPFDIEKWELDVLVNPCEKIDHEESTIQALIATTPTSTNGEEGNSLVASAAPTVSSLEGVQQYMKELISKKTEIPLTVITSEDRIMSQLHLNSLAITEIISLVTKSFNKSHKVFSAASIAANADSTIAEVSKVIFDGASGQGKQDGKAEIAFDLVHNWTNIFQRTAIIKSIGKIKMDNGKGDIIVKGYHPSIKEFEKTLAGASENTGNGAIYIHHADHGEEYILDFVHFLNQMEVRQGKFVTLVTLKGDSINTDLLPILRSFQQEVPHISTYGITIDENLDNIIEIIQKEIQFTFKYKEVIYDKEGQRRESQLEIYFPTSQAVQEAVKEEDVLLATGGGKGITYASIKQVAQETGAKLAIMGRSLPEKDATLKANLEELSTLGISYQYYSADVCNAEEVQVAMQQISKDLGKVTMILHGAGFNKPKPLTMLTEEDFKNTARVKVTGLQNILDLVDASQLKIVVGYGSIIAQSGMKGNADYAFANDQLARLIDNYGQLHDHVRCLTLEWSVWAGVGMGVNLNSIENLKNQGVWPIPMDQGCKVLTDMLADKQSKGRFIISGRYGNIPTINYVKSRLPIGRFISKIKHHIPKVEVVSEVAISLKDDIYLKNHVFQKQYVFPTVMILEGMAQVSKILGTTANTWSFENLVINKSIFIPENGTNKVRFIVTRLSDDKLQAVVQSEDSNFEVNCFEAIINLADQVAFKMEVPEELKDLELLQLDVSDKFYDDLLFHHGPFRRINSFYKVHARASLAGVDTSTTDQWFGPYIPDNCLLGDAGLNDAAIQCHQACRPGWNMLPTGAGKFILNPAEVEGPLYIKTVETSEDIVDVWVFNREGEIKLMWKDLTLTKVSGTSFSGKWNPCLLVPYIEYMMRDKTEKYDHVQLPKDLGWNMLDSLKEGQSTVSYNLEEYTICLTALDEQNSESFQFNEDTFKVHPFTKKIEIDNLEKPVVLQISKRDMD